MAYASQAAVVAENARLYDEEQRRTRELGGLQQIAQAIGSLRSPIELYSQITARIAKLMDVQMCGILLYDPRDRVLVSQRPFFGMDDEEAIKFYQLRSPPGSAVARLWQDRSTWFSNNLRTDPSRAGYRSGGAGDGNWRQQDRHRHALGQRHAAGYYSGVQQARQLRFH